MYFGMPSRDTLLLWVTLAVALVVGLVLIGISSSGLIHDIGIAAVVASLLGFTIDQYLKSRIVRDVFQASVGHILPPELREEILWITGFRLLARMSVHRITIEVAGDDLVKVTTILEREIENISSRSEKIAAIAEVDEWGFPGHQSEVLNCELSTYDGDRLQFTPPAENRGHYIPARSDEYTLPPGRTVRLFYKFVEYKRRNDIVTYGLKHPTRDPEMEISICPGLAYQASFGHHGDVIDLHVGRHVLRGTFLPNHILSVRWWPSRDEQPTAAK